MAADRVFDSDIRPWVKFEGEVEIRYGDGTTMDLLKYMNEDQEFIEYDGEFDSEMFKKNRQTNEQTVLWCYPCSAEQKNMGTFITHIKGNKHIRKVMEYRSLQQGLEKPPPQQPKPKKAKTQRPKESDSNCSLTELLQRFPTDPALGLEHIHEWNPPDGVIGVRWYTCTQKGCKSAWGKSFEMFAHLIGNKHNRNYLANNGVHGAMGLTQDKLLAMSQEFDRKERCDFNLKKDRDYSVMNRHFNDYEMYKELSARPKDWSETKEHQKYLREKKRLQQYWIIDDILKRASHFQHDTERATLNVADVTKKTLVIIKNGVESTLKSLVVAKLMAQKIHDNKVLDSIGILNKSLLFTKNKVNIILEMRKALRQYYINPQNPEMVCIPSETKFNLQVACLSSEVIMIEKDLNVDSVKAEDINNLVKAIMAVYKPLEDI